MDRFIEQIIGLKTKSKEEIKQMSTLERMTYCAAHKEYDAWVKNVVEEFGFTGSEKQINWAKDIMRHTLIVEMYDFGDECMWADFFKALMESSHEAKWWIENRDKRLSKLYPEVFKLAYEEICEIEKNNDYRITDKIELQRAQEIFKSTKF